MNLLRSWQYVWILLFVVLTSFGSTAQPKNVAILGSSTSACYGLNLVTECYIGRLETFYNSTVQLMNTQHYAQGGTNVYVAMPNGYTPPAGRPAPDPLHNIDMAISQGADVILVNFPTNDYNTYTVKEVMNCFRTIKQYATDHGKACFITTSQPRNDDAFSLQPARDSLRVLRDSILMNFGVSAINFYDGLAAADGSIKPEYDQGDHTHLNAAAHEILFERVRDKNILSTAAALPLTNLDFKTALSNGQVDLTWKNDPDFPAKTFTVQQSTDGLRFRSLGSLPGNSKNAYQFTDSNPANGFNYYRLEVALLSGKTDHSPVARVLNKTGELVLQRAWYAGRALHLDLDLASSQQISIRLVNFAGASMGSWNYNGHAHQNSITLPASALSRGTYIVKISAANAEGVTQPLLIQD